MRDFVKANFGLIVLLTIFILLLSSAMWVYFYNPRTGADDLQKWLLQKTGEVLAAIMTMIVGAVATMRRSTDNNPDKTGTGTPPPTSAATRTTVATGGGHP